MVITRVAMQAESTLHCLMSDLFRNPGRASTGLRSHSFVHPPLEESDAVLRPGSVAGHSSFFESPKNRFSLGFHIGIGRQVKAVILHRRDIGVVTEQRTNVLRKADSHRKPPHVDWMRGGPTR